MHRLISTLIAYSLAFSPLCHAAHAEESRGQRYLRMAADPNVSPLHKRAYQELARLPTEPFEGPIANPALPLFSSATLQNSAHPLGVLYRMGLDVLPVLVDALADNTPTRTVSGEPGHRIGDPDVRHVWPMNAVVGLLIDTIADRYIVLDDGKRFYYLGKDPDLAPKFKEAVLKWYQQNRNRTLAERKISDVNDEDLINRFSAIEWIGKHKEKTGQQAVMQRIGTIFTENKITSPLVDSELSHCALTLGQIGDRSALQHVRRVCAHLSSQQRTCGWMEMDDLFRAYHGLSLLGEKDEALRELKRVYDAYYAEKPSNNPQQFKEQLEAAQKW